MTADRAVVLDAATDELERAEMEAVLAAQARLGLIFAWHRQMDGAYCVEADSRTIKQLAMLGWPQDHHDAGLVSRKLQ